MTDLLLNRGNVARQLMLFAVIIFNLDQRHHLRRGFPRLLMTLTNERHQFIPLTLDTGTRRRELVGESRFIQRPPERSSPRSRLCRARVTVTVLQTLEKRFALLPHNTAS